MRLTAKLSLLFLLLSLIPIILVGYLTYQYSRSNIEQETIKHLTSTNILKEAELDEWLRDNSRALEILTSSAHFANEFVALLATHDPADSAHLAQHRAIIADHLAPVITGEEFLELFILRAADGLIVISTDRKQEGKYREKSPFFVAGKTHTTIQNVYFSMALQQPGMTISTPLKDSHGNLVAVLAGRLDLSTLSQMMERRSGLSPTEDTYLVNTFNFFITEPRFGQGYALKKSAHTEGVEAALSHRDGIGFYDNYRGVPVIGAYHWMPKRELCLITEISQAEAFAPIHALQKVMTTVAIGVAVFAALAGWLCARSITKPVHRLVDGTGEIGRGNLDYRVGTAGADEIGDLSRAFGQMTERLKETLVSRDELVKEVAERKRAEETILQERNFIDAALDSLPGLFYLFDDQGQFLRWNKNFEKVSGYSAEEIAHMSPLDLFGDPDKGTIAARIQQVFVTGEATAEGDFVSKDQTKTPCFFTGKLFSFEQTPCLVGMAIDITELKNAEKALRAISARQQALLSAVPDIIMEVDSNKVYTWVNQSGQEFFGDNAIGKEAAFYFEGEQETYLSVQPIFNGHGDTIYVESWQRRKDGQKRLLAWWCRVLKDDSGRVTGALSSARDITEVKEAENALLERDLQLQEKNAELERFVYTVSHDLKSPLVTIKTFLGYLENDVRKQDVVRMDQDLMYIRGAADKMGRLLDELLELSRIGRVVNPSVEVPLQAIVQEALELVAGQLSERGVQVDVTAEPVVLHGDRPRLLEVFQNLVDNAVKFMGDQPTPRVEIGVEQAGGETVFFVRDNGIGIDPRHQPKLFDLFEKLDPGTEGTGIGLALVRRIVEIHRGKIWVESAGVGQGTCFRFTLPGDQRC
jgi:PAS domain S-box-containing protein